MFRFDKRILYILIAIFAVRILSRYYTNENDLLNLVLILPAVIIAITFHEFAHAYAANRLGDDTAKKQGRLNLNPLSHIDPIGFIMLLTVGFGWGKPVEVNSRNFNRDISVSKAEAIISISGPIMNFIIAIVFAFTYGLLHKYNMTSSIIIYQIISGIIIINIGLGIFNLIPLPPLDGSKVLKHFLPYKARYWFEKNEQIFYFVFIFIWIFGVAGLIISPLISWTSYGLLTLVSKIIGI